MRIPLIGYLIFVCALLGVVINVCSILLLFLKNRPSLFHHLLKILAVFDTLVVVCCAISYGVPDVWPDYWQSGHPKVRI